MVSPRWLTSPPLLKLACKGGLWPSKDWAKTGTAPDLRPVSVAPPWETGWVAARQALLGVNFGPSRSSGVAAIPHLLACSFACQVWQGLGWYCCLKSTWRRSRWLLSSLTGRTCLSFVNSATRYMEHKVTQPSSFLPFCFLQLRKSVLPTLGSEWTAATLASQPRSAQIGSAASGHTPPVSPGASTTARSRKVTSRTRHCPSVPTDALQLQSRTDPPLLPSGGSECPGHMQKELAKPKEDQLLAQRGGVHGPPEPGTCGQRGSDVSTSPQLTPWKRCSYQTHIYVITGGKRLHFRKVECTSQKFLIPSFHFCNWSCSTPSVGSKYPWLFPTHLTVCFASGTIPHNSVLLIWIIARKHM